MQSVDVQVPVAPTPVRIAGRRQLAYELHITNLREVDVLLTGIETFDASSGMCLANYFEGSLAERIGRPGVGPELQDKRILGGGLRAVVYFWIAVPDDAPTPARLRHRISFEAILPAGRQSGSIDDVFARIDGRAAITLGAPLRGGPWVALYNPTMERGHRTSIYVMEGRARIPGRFAIDWVRLDEEAARARGDVTQVANWHGYGADVLAVVDAVVADVRDDMPEAATISAPQSPMRLEYTSGNYVTLDLGGGRYAFYEHLKYGSVRVKPGTHVKRGQVIAQLGNSGSSSAGPHLHFHVADAAATLAAEGVPYVIESFEVLGAYDRIDGHRSGERWKAVSPGVGGLRKAELPDANVVVVFP